MTSPLLLEWHTGLQQNKEASPGLQGVETQHINPLCDLAKACDSGFYSRIPVPEYCTFRSEHS